MRAQTVCVGKTTELETASKLGNGSCSFSRPDVWLRTPHKGAEVGMEGSQPTIEVYIERRVGDTCALEEALSLKRCTEVQWVRLTARKSSPQ